jgi:hypothetical protein
VIQKTMKPTQSTSVPGRPRQAAALVLFAVALLTADAHALRDPKNQGRWTEPCRSGPDAEVPGFLVNMGPTGARGILKEKSYLVKYIFRKSPADGVLKLDDEVYGANGKKFSAHTFGPRYHGLEGPMQDLGLAIEDSEGGDGILKLMVKRGGEDLKLDIPLEKLGRFSETFPLNCPKTETLKTRAYRYLIDNPGGLLAQGRCVEALALLGSNDPKIFRHGKNLAKDWNKPCDEETWSWNLAFQGITLAEYHLRTKDNSVLKNLESIMELLSKAQWRAPIHHWKSKQVKGTDQALLDKHQALYEGGFGHAPYPVIVKRGGGGYGPMQWPTCLAIMAWQLGKQCGVKVDDTSIEKAFEFLNRGTTEGGHIAYGGEFTLNGGPVDWKSWKANTNHSFSHKSGLGYLVYMLSPERKESKKMMKLHLENIDAAYQDMPDGHACALMGMTWGMAGVLASDDAKLKKKVFDYYKAWINLARCHGSDSYVILPGRDHADLSYYRGDIRKHTTAAVALLYSYSTPLCRLQGADGAAAEAGRSSSSSQTLPVELHTYRNADNSKSIVGSFVAFDPGVGLVRLRLSDGNTRDIPYQSLCEEDQNLIKKQAGMEEVEKP